MAGDLDSQAAGVRRLKDKVCIVTGAGQGIGRATARRLGDRDDPDRRSLAIAPLRSRCIAVLWQMS